MNLFSDVSRNNASVAGKSWIIQDLNGPQRNLVATPLSNRQHFTVLPLSIEFLL